MAGVLEQGQLTGGTTWHAAGLVSQLKSSHSLTRLATYSARLFEELEEETGQATGMLPRCVLRNVDVCYISDNPVLDGRNAAYSDGAIYMKLDEPTNEDMIENFVHEVAHAVELEDPHEILLLFLIIIRCLNKIQTCSIFR